MNDYDSAGHGLDSGFVLKEILLVNSITDIKYSETQPIIKAWTLPCLFPIYPVRLISSKGQQTDHKIELDIKLYWYGFP